MRKLLPLAWILFFAGSCAVHKKYDPSRKFSPAELQADYRLFRTILESSHPSLYWYTPKDSIDHYFDQGYRQLSDSLPEYQFRNILSRVVAQFRCGHTSVRSSAAAYRYADKTRSYALPLSVKAWPDTVVVTFNLNRRDSQVTRGVILRSIEGRPIQAIVDSFFNYLSGDGYNTTHKYQTLSNGGMFRNMYGSLFGLRREMEVGYVDTAGQAKTALVKVYDPTTDTPHTRAPVPRLSRKKRRELLLESARRLQIDTALRTGFMELNGFSRSDHLRKFFRQSFRKLKKENIRHLVIDLRGNGGGSVVLSNLLTRYLSDRPFKIADSIYALKRRLGYRKYMDHYWESRLFLFFLARREKDGHYHFRYYENKYFQPKTRNHFNGEVYLLTGGNTFSAATLFAKTLQGEKHVTIVGEETGGGAYGNTAWLIPEVTLPHTKVRFRLPLFRLVIDRNAEKGRGVMPGVPSLPTVRDVRSNTDFKMEKVRELIREKNAGSH
ncbi:MAG: S41 family peptidase [Flavisolibacter sp.]